VRNLVLACIAKNPADRPASAAHLARAAQSLRQGDVVAAAAAVPGIMAAGILPALQRENQTSQTTRLLTTAMATESQSTTAPIATKRRNPWTWPLVALIAIFLVVIIGTIIALVGNPTPKAVQTPSAAPPVSASPSPTPSPTPTPTPTSDVVNIAPNEFIGRTLPDVQAALNQLGLGANMVPDASPAPSADKVGTAYFVNPTGNVPKDEVITVRFYGSVPPSPSQPAAPTTADTTATIGSTITVTIPAYTGCPSGASLQFFTFTPSDGSSVKPANPVGPTATTLQWTLALTPGPNTLSYVAQCTDGVSPASNALTVTGSAATAGP
jgi:serine/threonine-protein kinase